MQNLDKHLLEEAKSSILIESENHDK